ncbi:uncharacterized protein LOC129304583 [Prosopis cineraria]|uniref:uncharacterized protein LOC129304583 n=1 Tax=Prosopis cineraria TaxID=364024 RepID=UPI00240F9ECB|nr:uncharacterized protein LOC129304583 [Prosopis cineraria]
MRGSAVAPRVTRILATSHLREEEESSVGDGVEFEFLDDGEVLTKRSSISSSDECCSNEMELLDDDVDGRENDSSVEENRSFWDNQQQLLQSVICRTSSIETGVRNATKEVVKEIQSAETVCGCGSQVAPISCRRCLMREVLRRLQSLGYNNSALCKTKWRTSKDIPAGEHNFIDVIDSKSSKKGEVRVIIELNFRAEFEMARGSEDYNRLVRRLPEVFVGKAERLSNVIKVMCMAAKKCMEQKKMHLGPWRKQRYMRAKWLGPCERNTINWTGSFNMWDNNSSADQRMTMKTKPKASMLTVDLLDKLPSMHYKAVEVV